MAKSFVIGDRVVLAFYGRYEFKQTLARFGDDKSVYDGKLEEYDGDDREEISKRLGTGFEYIIINKRRKIETA